MTKEEILSQLKKEGVNNLDDFANLVVTKSHKDGKSDGPIVAGVIIYTHGFVTH